MKLRVWDLEVLVVQVVTAPHPSLLHYMSQLMRRQLIIPRILPLTKINITPMGKSLRPQLAIQQNL